MTEYILLGILVGLLILWIISIHHQLNETTKELNRIIVIFGNKEQWELSKYECERIKSFREKEMDFITHSYFSDYRIRLENLEKKAKKKWTRR